MGKIPFEGNPIGYVKDSSGPSPTPIPTDYIYYAPLTGYALSAETGQEFQYYEVYDYDPDAFKTINDISCLNCNGRLAYVRVNEDSLNQGTDKPRAYSLWINKTYDEPSNMRGIALGAYGDSKEMCSPNNGYSENTGTYSLLQAGGYGQDFPTNIEIIKASYCATV